MRRYETIFIARPGLGEDDVEAITGRATETITEHDGSIVTIDKWGLKKLAYPIKKEQQGIYVFIEYAGMPAAVAEVERVFRIDDRILKYLTVKTQDVFSHIEPKVVAPKNDDDDEAGADEE